jgi:hypothetical protein
MIPENTANHLPRSMVHSSPDVARFIVVVAVLGRNRNMETAPAATTICPAVGASLLCAPHTQHNSAKRQDRLTPDTAERSLELKQ